ncbi:MAG: hypothetical protein AAFQ64_15015 [Pseudomonadota bacterium]
MIRQFLKKRRRGAMAMVAVVGMMPVSAMLNANINTSQIIEDRRHAQDAADALAKTHGVWSARALNVIAMNNVTSTQLLTVAIGSEALDQALLQLMATAGLQAGAITVHGLIECAPLFPELLSNLAWGAFCGSYHGLAARPAVTAGIKAIEVRNRFAPDHGVAVARKALAAIDGMNKELIARHPRAMREISTDYARFLGINDHHFANPCGDPLNRGCRQTNSTDGMALPLVPGGFPEQIERCLAMDNGAIGRKPLLVHTTFPERGFPAGKGPMRDGGSQRRPAVVDHINAVTDIGVILADYDRFYKSALADLPRHPLHGPGTAFPRPVFLRSSPHLYSWIEVGIMRSMRMFPSFFDRNPARSLPLAMYRDKQRRNGPNDFTQTFQFKHFTLCPTAGLPRPFPLLPIPLLTQAPDLWKLPGVSPAGRALDRTPDQMDDAFRILAFAQKEQANRLDMMIPYLGGQVSEGDTAPHTAYGQVGLYNPDGASLYSQSWKARLMPATRMDDVSQAATNLNREATAAFDPLASALRSVADQATWRRIHAH